MIISQGSESDPPQNVRSRRGLKHFARAAAASNLSQPAVSHQIALLERKVGARLFNRTGRRVSLTVAGEVLLEEPGRVLAAVDRARERMTAVTSRAGRSVASGLAPRQQPGCICSQYCSPNTARCIRHSICTSRSTVWTPSRSASRAMISTWASFRDAADWRAANETTLWRSVRCHPAGRRTKDKVIAQSRSRKSVLGAARRGLSDASSCGGVDAATRSGPCSHDDVQRTGTVKRAVMARLGVSIVSAIAVADDLKRGHLTRLSVATPLPAVTAHVMIIRKSIMAQHARQCWCYWRKPSHALACVSPSGTELASP